MAEGKVEPRDINWRHHFPWTEIFRGFQLALDPKKLLLAAGGILVMSLGWWLLSLIFYSTQEMPKWKSPTYNTNWADFKKERAKWNVLHEAAGPEGVYTDAGDLAASSEEYDKIVANWPSDAEFQAGTREFTVDGKLYRITEKRYGRLRTLPWFEDRGPNPYLLVTGHEVAWERGGFVEWLFTQQFPVLIEPLVKLIRPVYYLLHPDAGVLSRFYFLLVMLWTLATWALFGAAITRIASVQIARNEKITLKEAVRFVVDRYGSYFLAPLFPLALVAIITIGLILFGIGHLIPYFGDVWSGLLWPLVIFAGLAMAVVLVGLIGWPLMFATISAEGSDSFDAISRAYSYIYQAPWQFAWYCLVAICYGSVLVFFIGFMGSLTVYLGKWAVSQTPSSSYFNREPEYLFVYAPTSWHWRDHLLQGAQVEGRPVVENGRIDLNAYNTYASGDVKNESLTFMNKVGAFFVAVWVYTLFLFVLGFGYSYFWCASTIIYFLMRRKVDDTDVSEVYLEEEDMDTFGDSKPLGTPVPTTAVTAGPSVTMVEPPSLRTPATPSGSPRTESSEGITTSAGVATSAPPSSPPEQSPNAPPSGDGGSSPPGG